MPDQDTPPKNVGEGASRWDRAALVGAAILVLGAAAVSIAALRGPLSMESLTSGMNRIPRAIWALLALALGAPSIVAASDRAAVPLRALWERIVAALAALAGALLAWKLPTAWPRAAFDEWERSFGNTHAGIPWSAVAAMVLAALVALNFALAWRRAIASPRRSPALSGAIAAVAVLAFALPASATVYLATGSRLVPVGAPDELWAPAFDEASCPPGPSASPTPSVAASASKP